MLPYDRVWATPLNVYEQTLGEEPEPSFISPALKQACCSLFTPGHARTAGSSGSSTPKPDHHPLEALGWDATSSSGGLH